MNSEILREGEFLSQRRVNSGLTIFNVAAIGVIQHLPEPPLS